MCVEGVSGRGGDAGREGLTLVGSFGSGLRHSPECDRLSIWNRLDDGARAAVERPSSVDVERYIRTSAGQWAAVGVTGDTAQALGIKQPAALKIERQTDLYLSTLRRFVEAAGGTLELRVKLPGKGGMHLTGMGDLSP